MMRGCSQYELIEDSVFLKYAYTLRKYNYWMQRDGDPIPMLATSENTLDRFPPPLKIKGEVHAVKSYAFSKLDIVRDNLVSFRRQRVQVLIPHNPVYKLPERYDNGKPIPLMTDQFVIGTERVEPMWVWMYVGVPEYWNDVLDAGYLFSTVPHYKDERSWLGEYYSMKREKVF